jgi:hypothetical protein
MARRKTRKRDARRPLFQRAVLHALKTLVKDHPRAALSAAGAGAGYALSSVAHDASDAVRYAAEDVKRVFVTERARPPLGEAECADMLGAMTPRQRRAFAALADRNTDLSGLDFGEHTWPLRNRTPRRKKPASFHRKRSARFSP